VKLRIAMAKAAFNDRKELLTKSIKLKLKKTIIKCLVWSIALYGCETWTLRCLNSLEMWIWRKMLKISWKEKQTNENVLQSVEEKRSLVDTISSLRKTG